MHVRKNILLNTTKVLNYEVSVCASNIYEPNAEAASGSKGTF